MWDGTGPLVQQGPDERDGRLGPIDYTHYRVQYPEQFSSDNPNVGKNEWAEVVVCERYGFIRYVEHGPNPFNMHYGGMSGGAHLEWDDQHRRFNIVE